VLTDHNVSLFSPNKGDRNVFCGAGAGGSGTGGDNVAIGFSSGSALTTGGNNILIGRNSGRNLTIGHHNILIGDNIQASSSAASFELSIGSCLQSRNKPGGLPGYMRIAAPGAEGPYRTYAIECDDRGIVSTPWSSFISTNLENDIDVDHGGSAVQVQWSNFDVDLQGELTDGYQFIPKVNGVYGFFYQLTTDNRNWSEDFLMSIYIKRGEVPVARQDVMPALTLLGQTPLTAQLLVSLVCPAGSIYTFYVGVYRSISSSCKIIADATRSFLQIIKLA
jgi:hypothetical protein